jgi:hypothetical protein
MFVLLIELVKFDWLIVTFDSLVKLELLIRFYMFEKLEILDPFILLFIIPIIFKRLVFDIFETKSSLIPDWLEILIA